jgi:hypothetical protein
MLVLLREILLLKMASCTSGQCVYCESALLMLKEGLQKCRDMADDILMFVMILQEIV